MRRLNPQQLEDYTRLWGRIGVEVFVSREIHRERVEERVRELSAGWRTFPWQLLTEDDINARVEQAYGEIGEI